MILKSFCAVLLLCASYAVSWAQYNNEWINYTQTYYKIPVAQTGIYRLTYQDLQNAGFPVNAVDPRLLQVYHRGVEQAIYFKHDQLPADSRFDAAEFLEFFGKKNDGTLDADLYRPASLQPHSYFNLYSDTSAYFLTWSNTATLGKRMETFFENNVTNQVKETYHIQERLLVLNNQYSAGNLYGNFNNNYTNQSFFDNGEGWTGEAISQGQFRMYTLENILNGQVSAGQPQLEILLAGRDVIAHTAEIYVGPNSSSLRLLTTENFEGYDVVKISSLINWTDVGPDGKLVVRLSAPSATTNRPQFSASYLKLTFPQSFNFTNQSAVRFELAENGIGKSYVEIENSATGLRLWDVTNSNTPVMVGTRLTGGILSAMVSQTNTPRLLWASNVTLTTTLKKVSFRPINPASHNFLIVSHRALMKSAGAYSDPVKAYSIYRASVAGGSYDTLTVPIDLLYNQFNYGETSPRAIYQFVKFMAQANPKYLFLIGKGRDIDTYSPYQRKPLASGELIDLVPSSGYPASDMLFSAGINGNEVSPAIPVGRLPATSSAQVAAYLDKIKEHETSGLDAGWKKEALHLSGGIQPSELVFFRSYVDGFGTIAEGPLWGGHVTTIAKRDPNPSELINVSDIVNKGVNMVTFFGHSSPGTIDIDIGFATDPTMGYNNPGKYPAFLINGCNAGAFFLNQRIFGEDWILASGKGARNFIAHSSFGYAGLLQLYTELFYKTAFADPTYITLGIGDVQQKVATDFIALYGSNPLIVAQAQQMVCLGDPSVKLFGTATPDYSISNQGVSLVSLDGKPVTATSDEFALRLIVKNTGASDEAPLKIKVTRTLSNATTLTYDSLFNPVLFQDTLMFKLTRAENGAGTNRFDIVLDPDNAITELSKSNNAAFLTANILSAATLNLLPSNFGIVTNQVVEFKFQDSNLLSQSRAFLFELDTVPTFDSPYLQRQEVTATVLAKTNRSILLQDSLVYYWRTKFKTPLTGESSDWTAASFTYIQNGEQGWAQLRYPQFIQNSFSDIQLNEDNERLEYLESTVSLLVKTFGSNHPALPTDVSIRINNTEYNLGTQGQPCRDNTINLVAFNKTSAVPYAAIPFNFQDPRSCGREPQVINSFTVTEVETGLNDDLITAITAIAPSDSVVLFSIGDAGIACWSPTLLSKLGELGIGAPQLTSLQAGEPLILLGRKGAAPGTAKLFKATTAPLNEQEIQVSASITGRNTIGTVRSSLIGPALLWKKFTPKMSEVSANDQARFTIYGVTITGTETLLQTDVTGQVDLSIIDASVYPYLRLELSLQDQIDLTAAQLEHWFVVYEPAPEGLLIFLGERAAQTLQEGQVFQTRYGFVNISNKDFTGSLTVDYDMLTAASGFRESKTIEIAGPAVNDTTRFAVEFVTVNKVGKNSLTVNVNNLVRPELYIENNSLTLSDYLLVTQDQIPPRLDVTIDGRYVLNNDMVSPNPRIQVKLFDENPFLLKTDTAQMRISLKYPCAQITCPFTPIYFRSNQVTWTPATLSAPFTATAQLSNLPDGEYTLQVDAADASGNKSGATPYAITFLVKNEPSFIFKSVYPNPSKSLFNFQFVLTGNQLPDDFQLEIFSSAGSLVRKFGMEDVQRFFIGTNELEWDGKSAEGYSLERGIYLYRLRIRMDGKESAQQNKLILLR